VDNKELPEATSISFSPLIVMVTGPEGDNFSLVKSNKATNSNSKIKKATTVITMVPNVVDANIILVLN